MTCTHLQEATTPRDAVMLYGVDGDFPDLICTSCVDALNKKQLDPIRTTCSRCLVDLIRRHRVVSTAWYGQ